MSSESKASQARASAKQRKTKTVARCMGQCDEDDAYSHDYLHCPNCHIQPTPCTIQECPCGGQGMLIPTTERTIYSHQMPSHNKSIRVYSTRKGQAAKRVNGMFAQFGGLEAIQTSPNHNATASTTSAAEKKSRKRGHEEDDLEQEHDSLVKKAKKEEPPRQQMSLFSLPDDELHLLSDDEGQELAWEAMSETPNLPSIEDAIIRPAETSSLSSFGRLSDVDLDQKLADDAQFSGLWDVKDGDSVNAFPMNF